MAAIPKNVEMEAAKFLHKLIQESTDEPTNLATKLHVILQHMRFTGKENSMPYQVISRAMETVIRRHGLDIEALMSQSQLLTGGSQPSLSQMAGEETATFSSKPLHGPSSSGHDMYQGSVNQLNSMKIHGANVGVSGSYESTENAAAMMMHKSQAGKALDHEGGFPNVMANASKKLEVLTQKGNQVSGFTGKDMNNAGRKASTSVLGGRKREDQEFMSYKKTDDRESLIKGTKTPIQKDMFSNKNSSYGLIMEKRTSSDNICFSGNPEEKETNLLISEDFLAPKRNKIVQTEITCGMKDLYREPKRPLSKKMPVKVGNNASDSNDNSNDDDDDDDDDDNDDDDGWTLCPSIRISKASKSKRKATNRRASKEKQIPKKVKDDSNKKERSNEKKCSTTNTSEEKQIKEGIMDTVQNDVKSTPQNGPKMRSCRTGSTKSKISDYGFFYGNWENSEDDVVLEEEEEDEEEEEEDFANDDEGNVDKNDKQTSKELFGLKNVKTMENDIDSIEEKKQKSIVEIVKTKETLKSAKTKEILKNIKLENDIDFTEKKKEKSFVKPTPAGLEDFVQPEKTNQIEDHDELLHHFEADSQNATAAMLSPNERMNAIEKELKDQKEAYNHDKEYFKSRLDDVVKTVETSNSQIGQVFKVLESINDRVSSNYTKDELHEIFSGLRGDLATVNNRLNLVLTQPLFTPAQLSQLESQFDVAKNGKML